MKGLFGRLVWRPLGLEPGRAALAILAVALGVAVFLSIRLANRAASVVVGKLGTATCTLAELQATL